MDKVATLQYREDRVLARRVASGEQGAFDEFFREYFPRLFRFVLARVRNDEALAEEIVQRTMCIVVRKIGDYRGEAKLFSWLCQICRFEAAAIARQQGEEDQFNVALDENPVIQAAVEAVTTENGDPVTEQYNDELATYVKQTLESLPGNYATALEMKYILGCSVNEIAEELGLRPKAAESILTRARNAFRESFRTLWKTEPDFL